jgi:hypothetical protein
VRNNYILLAASALGVMTLLSAPASAAVVYQSINADLQAAPYSISFDGGGFTFSSTGDPFNPLAVQTTGGGEVTAFGGFLGIPIEPTSDFTNRGTVVYGPGQYAAFPAPTTVPYSNGENFIGLEAAENGQDYFGYVFTTDTTLNGFGYETVANQSILASAVPEPSTWALMMAGVAMLGFFLRAGRRRSAASIAV